MFKILTSSENVVIISVLYLIKGLVQNNDWRGGSLYA